jgi:hypothetical protein
MPICNHDVYTAHWVVLSRPPKKITPGLDAYRKLFFKAAVFVNIAAQMTEQSVSLPALIQALTCTSISHLRHPTLAIMSDMPWNADV